VPDDRLFDTPPVIDRTPNAEVRRRFQIAHLLADRRPVDIAADLAVPKRTVQRWLQHGVGWETAELIACKLLGVPAMFQFGEEWEAEADRACHVDLAPSLFDDEVLT
jgi:hypothetical protein